MNSMFDTSLASVIAIKIVSRKVLCNRIARHEPVFACYLYDDHVLILELAGGLPATIHARIDSCTLPAP